MTVSELRDLLDSCNLDWEVRIFTPSQIVEDITIDVVPDGGLVYISPV